MTRDWEKFWSSHTDSTSGVYGSPNENLLKYAKDFTDFENKLNFKQRRL